MTLSKINETCFYFVALGTVKRFAKVATPMDDTGTCSIFGSELLRKIKTQEN